MSRRVAVVLFNLGGPDSLEAVEPFLFNLFSDPAIIGLPTWLRRFVARRISRARGPTARAIYQEMGGRSPIVPETQAQAAALKKELESRLGPGSAVMVTIAMRYWYPRATSAMSAIEAFDPDDIVLLPLYPQYSTTTTQSSLSEWTALAEKRVSLPETSGAKTDRPRTHVVCCYPAEADFVAAHAAQIDEALRSFGERQDVRVLFSAHGLPERTVAKGDPYQRQVEQSAAAIAALCSRRDLDWRVSYQSRVGPLKWIGPSTEEEIAAAGASNLALIVVPIAFVSEHSETLVELDIEYAALAKEKGVETYVRVPALGTHPKFISALAEVTRRALESDNVLCPETAPGHVCTSRIGLH